MMGVYINMEMPKSCGDCKAFVCYRQWAGDVGDCFCGITKNDAKAKEKNADCPLVPVPPHGRLIDADAAIEDIRGEILEHQMNGMKGTPFYIEDLRTMWQRLEDEDIIPTIIPAEEGE